LPLRLGREPPPSPRAESVGFVPGHVRNGEGFWSPPNRGLWSRLARRIQEALVLAPGHLGLVHEEALDAHEVPRTLGGIACGLRASHLEFAAWDVNDDRAVSLAPELFPTLRVAPEGNQPARGRGGTVPEVE